LKDSVRKSKRTAKAVRFFHTCHMLQFILQYEQKSAILWWQNRSEGNLMKTFDFWYDLPEELIA